MRNKGWTFIKKACTKVMLPIGMLAAFACQDDMIAEKQSVTTDDGRIKFAIVERDSAWSALSRSAEPTAPVIEEQRRFLTIVGTDSVFLITRVEDNAAPKFADVPASRAATTALPSFRLYAYLNDGAQFMNNQLVEKQSNGNWEYSPIKCWPNNPDAKVHFYGYAPVKIKFADEAELTYPATAPVYTADTENGGYIGTFSHTVPASRDDMRDAERQPDLIFSAAPDMSKQSITDAVHLRFYHALSAVVFKVGNMPDGTEIQNISIANVKSSGECTMTSGSSGVISFDWEEGQATDTYVQAFNKENVTANQVLTEDATTFMMIPQELKETSCLVIRFHIGQHDYEYTHPLIMKDDKGNVISDTWDSNKKYTYTLSTTEVVEVDVTDQVTGELQTKKEQVKIQNTGLVPSYIRAAIVGYWTNEDGDVVAGWNPTDDEGSFTGLENDKWFKGDDGFYYHKAIVPIGEYTNELFTTYELTGKAPIVGAALELNIVAQSVKAETTVPWAGVSVGSNKELTKN